MQDNKTDKIINEIISDLDGVDVSKVELKKEGPKRTRRKKEEMIVFREEKKKEAKKRQQLEVLDMYQPDEIEWGVYRKKKRTKPKEVIDEWTKVDFVLFARSLYLQKFKRKWDLRIPAACIEIGRIRDELTDIFGIATNLLIRDYIFFFFQNHIDYCVRKEKDFYFSQMRKKSIIEHFYDQYDYKKSFEDKITKGQDKKESLLNSKAIKNSCSVSMKNLVFNYGIVIAINWLIMNKKVDSIAAVERVYNSCVGLRKKKLFKVVKKSTEEWSPYPTWFVFKKDDIDSFARRLLGKSASIKTEFSDSDIINNNFTFIKGK